LEHDEEILELNMYGETEQNDEDQTTSGGDTGQTCEECGESFDNHSTLSKTDYIEHRIYNFQPVPDFQQV